MSGTAAAASCVSRSVVAATAATGMGLGLVAISLSGSFAASPNVVSWRRPTVERTTLAISASTAPGGELGFYA
jgi:hypothetical protein